MDPMGMLMIHVETTKANAELVAIQAPIRRSSLPFLRKTLLVIATPVGHMAPSPCWAQASWSSSWKLMETRDKGVGQSCIRQKLQQDQPSGNLT
jgi:hypothetical protein